MSRFYIKSIHVETVTANREIAANHLAYTYLYMFLVAVNVCCMKKVNSKIIISVVIAVVVVLVVWFIRTKDGIPQIKADDVARIYYEDFRTSNNDKELDIEEFLGYYDQIYDVKENKTGEGTTPESRIVIELKNGSEVGIYDQSKKFEISFRTDDGEIKQYWGTQQEIYNMIRYGSYEGKE